MFCQHLRTIKKVIWGIWWILTDFIKELVFFRTWQTFYPKLPGYPETLICHVHYSSTRYRAVGISPDVIMAAYGKPFSSLWPKQFQHEYTFQCNTVCMQVWYVNWHLHVLCVSYKSVAHFFLYFIPCSFDQNLHDIFIVL